MLQLNITCEKWSYGVFRQLLQCNQVQMAVVRRSRQDIVETWQKQLKMGFHFCDEGNSNEIPSNIPQSQHASLPRANWFNKLLRCWSAHFIRHVLLKAWMLSAEQMAWLQVSLVDPKGVEAVISKFSRLVRGWPSWPEADFIQNGLMGDSSNLLDKSFFTAGILIVLQICHKTSRAYWHD